uniref:Ig-like domain-containing protein n=1 Tax=Xiphophorus couchianus TaxID=32473 RepID=A0A3B5N0J3_9TELE
HSDMILPSAPSCQLLHMMIMVFGILLHMSLQVSAVETYEGQSILLFCEFEIFELDRPTVKWSRSDLSPPIVHQRQEEGDELMDQNQLYTGRTSMKADALETGDLSLKLTNLQTSDTGTYSCTVRNVMGERRVRDEELLVKELFPSWAKALLVLFVLVLTVAAGIILYYFRHRLRPELKVEMEKKKMHSSFIYFVFNVIFYVFCYMLNFVSTYNI